MNWSIPRGILRDSTAALRRFGTPSTPHEGVVLWGGVRSGEHVAVTHALPLVGAKTAPRAFEIPLHEARRAGHFFRYNRMTYVAHLHSHPPDAGVDHSLGDDRRIYLKHDGLLSIVVGAYARSDDCLDPITNAGCHVHEHDGFRRMSDSEVRRRITLE